MQYKSSPVGEAAIDFVARDLFDEMCAWRRHLHSHPEIGFAEHDTTAYIRALLTDWDVPFEATTETGTVATLRGQTLGAALMLRADIDALPIQEETGLPFASIHPGVMHACGHDGHAAIVLGLIRHFAQYRDTIRGEIRFLFQPAEETAEGGAPRIIEAGALNGVSAVAAVHLLSSLATGTIALSEGPVLGSEDRFDITVTGRGGHASGPHETIDAVVVAAALVGQLQTLVSRRVDPLLAATLSVGSLHAGDAYNVIAGSAMISGTVRTLSPKARDVIAGELVALTEGFAKAHGAVAQVEYFRGSPPLINHAAATDYARPAARGAVGSDGVVAAAPFLGGEDFAYYGEHVPTVFAFVGAGDDSSHPLHHPKFDIDETALAIGLRYLIDLVSRWSDQAAAGLSATMTLPLDR